MQKQKKKEVYEQLYTAKVSYFSAPFSLECLSITETINVVNEKVPEFKKGDHHSSLIFINEKLSLKEEEVSRFSLVKMT